MLMETLGVGLIIPVLALVTDPDVLNRYSKVGPLLERIGNPDQITLVVGSMVVLLVVYTVKTGFIAFLTWRQSHFAYGVQIALSQRMFEGYLRQPYAFHLQRNSAQLIQNVSGEVQLFAYSITVVASLLSETLVLIGVSALLLVVEPIGALIVISILGVISWLFYGINKSRVLRWGETRQYHDGQRIQHMQQGFGGVKDVKLLGREDEFFAQYLFHTTASANTNKKQTVMVAMPRLLLEWLAVLGLAILVFSMLAQGKPVQSLIPTLGLFAAAAFRLIPSVNRILSGMQHMRYSLPVIDRIYNEIVGLETDKKPTREGSLEIKYYIKLEKVGYIYSGAEQPALSNISLQIPKGSSTGFIGGSGAGKSTLIDIIIGLLTPTEGRVLIDETDIRENLRGWQDQIGYVPQFIFLTDDTLRRNIAFGLSEDQIDDNAVRHAIKAAQLHDFVDSLSEGVNTIVGERGVRLSGGQRQRIGIARALYHDPQILVLDEATSALDTETEEGIMKAVNVLHGEKTIIIVAHRLSTVSRCDHLYRMENGHIVQDGEFNEVVNT